MLNKKTGLSYFGQVKPSDRQRHLEEAAIHLYTLVKQFENDPEVKKMNSYKILTRVLSEQCEFVTDDESGDDIQGLIPIRLKEPKKVPSDSLQNPSDPDASYSGHKGQGFQCQITETINNSGAEGPDKKPNFITAMIPEQAHESDAHAVAKAIEATESNGLAPKTLLADTAYGSDENCQLAEEHGIELVSPVSGKDKAKDKEATGKQSLADFKVDEDGKITKCPAGHAPTAIKRNRSDKGYKVGFDSVNCHKCPLFLKCLVKIADGSGVAIINYTLYQLRLALRRAYENTADFKNLYRWRSGIEATNSHLARECGFKHLRVRGFPAVGYRLVLKGIGENIRRAMSAIRRKVAYSL